MKFAALGYYDEVQFQTIPPAEQSAMMEACLAYDDELTAKKLWADGGQGLAPARETKTLRRQGGQLLVTDGPFTETKEQLGGFGVLVADDMDHAVAIMRKHPGTRMGPFEIRPIDEGLEKQDKAVSGGAAAIEPAALEQAPAKGVTVVGLGYHPGDWRSAMTAADQQAMLDGSFAFARMLREGGHWVEGFALAGVRSAKTVRASGGKVLVTDGPFAETKEHLGGVIVVRAPSLAAATELFSQHPALGFDVVIEVRPIDAAFTAFVEERKKRLRG